MNSVLSKFDRFIKTQVIYISGFISSLIIELLSLILFFAFLTKSALFALGLAIFFLTLFSFFLFRVYYQAIKREQFESFIKEWIEDVRLKHGEIRLADELTHFADTLSGREYSYYPRLQRFQLFNSVLSQLSFWCHWEDLMIFRELLLKQALKEYFKMIQTQPTHLGVHTDLANTYIKLSSLYRSFLQKLNKNQDAWFWLKKHSDTLESHFKLISEKAIEEMKILKELAPMDANVDLQLAFLYNDLKMIPEETGQYESIVEKSPHNEEALFQLGSLYFQQGRKAKGLQVYQQLKQRQVANAEELLKHYDV
jgi:hypothetical protein